MIQSIYLIIVTDLYCTYFSGFPALSLPQIMGDNMTTTLFLDVIDYHKKSLTGQRIPIGKPVRLKGVLDGMFGDRLLFKSVR